MSQVALLVIGGVLGYALDRLSRRESWLYEKRYDLYREMRGAVGEISQAVQTAAELRKQPQDAPRVLAVFQGEYASALSKFSTTANRAPLLCRQDVHDAIDAMNSHYNSRVTPLFDVARWDEWPDPKLAATELRWKRSWPPMVQFQDLADNLLTAMRKEIGLRRLRPG